MNEKIRFYVVEGMRVVDMSFWPMVLTSAPMATTYAAGEKIVEEIKRAYGLGGLWKDVPRI